MLQVGGAEGPAGAPEEVVTAVVDALESGLVAGLPTDTVYGLAASIRCPESVAGLFALKQRPGGVPVALLVAGEDQAWSVGDVTPLARRLATDHWPGGLTMVLQTDPTTARLVGSTDDSIGLRCPDHRLVRAVAERVGPIATTSANPHGGQTPITAAGVAEAFPSLAVLVDGGSCAGAPSTVVDARGSRPVVLRQGEVHIAGR